MPVSVIVGGQFGSEGKGKVAAWLADGLRAPWVVRCGGSNAGHTVCDAKGGKHIFRHLPTACINGVSKCLLAAGSYIDASVLEREVKESGIGPDRLFIDPAAVIITEEDKDNERRGIVDAIGSTGSGTGAAVVRRLSRNSPMLFAKDLPAFAPYIRDTKELLDKALRSDERVIIEGTQGYGLSVLHSGHYPYVTSRDTTAAAFISESGISPLYVDDICLVIRAFPIRVAGNSGELPDEISWGEVAEGVDFDGSLVEYTSVTGNIRRVGRFDPAIVRQAIAANAPTRVFLNHLDHIPAEAHRRFVDWVAEAIGMGIDYVGTGPRTLVPYDQYAKPQLRAV